MPIHSSVLELVGRTPIVRARRLDTGPCTLYLKLESQNPGGSIKDRIGLSMIEAAERRGDIKPGDTLVEGTAGNTGIGLALVAQQKGYKLILVVPDKMSREKIFNLKAMGAEVVLTRSDVGKGHPEYYQDLAAKIAADTRGAYFVNQFGNPDNPVAHETGTGPEIIEQMAGVGGFDAQGGHAAQPGHVGDERAEVFLAAEDAAEHITNIQHVGAVEMGIIESGQHSGNSEVGQPLIPMLSDFCLSNTNNANVAHKDLS